MSSGVAVGSAAVASTWSRHSSTESMALSGAISWTWRSRTSAPVFSPVAAARRAMVSMVPVEE